MRADRLGGSPWLGRWWRWLGAGLWAALGLWPALAVASMPEMSSVQVAPGAYYVRGLAALGSGDNQNFIANAGFVVTDAGVVVIDALGSPALATRLLAEIRRRTDQPVRYVIATHYHADHIYGLQVFKDAGATVLAHAQAQAYLASEGAQQRLAISRQDIAPWVDGHTRLVPPDRWVGQNDALAPQTLTLGGTEFVLIPAGPSHTPEDLMVHVPALGLLYAGDLVFRGRVPFVGQADSAGWIRALDRVGAMPLRVLVPGHGEVSFQPQADLAFTRDYLQLLRQRMAEGVRDMASFDDTYQRCDWSAYAALPLFEAAHRINAYNVYLQMERELP